MNCGRTEVGVIVAAVLLAVVVVTVTLARAIP